MSETDWYNVESSNIDQLGYDDESKLLHVRFNNGAENIFKDVPANVFEELLFAKSASNYLNQYIKGVYDFYKLSG